MDGSQRTGLFDNASDDDDDDDHDDMDMDSDDFGDDGDSDYLRFPAGIKTERPPNRAAVFVCEHRSFRFEAEIRSRPPWRRH